MSEETPERYTYDLDPAYVTKCANCHYWAFDSDADQTARARYSNIDKLGGIGLCIRRSPTPAREIPIMVPVIEGPQLIMDQQKIFTEQVSKVFTMSHACWPWTFGVEGCGEGAPKSKSIGGALLPSDQKEWIERWKDSMRVNFPDCEIQVIELNGFTQLSLLQKC